MLAVLVTVEMVVVEVVAAVVEGMAVTLTGGGNNTVAVGEVAV